MSSGFVSGGTTDQPRERNELWQKAEEELEAARQRKLEQRNHDGKSLYEVLQENKAAKQEAFEEAAKLKHQFRSLDEDDVAFLNSIRESESAKEREVEKATRSQLDEFRRLQQEQEARAKNAAVDETSTAELKDFAEDRGPVWHVAPRKRKRDRDHSTGAAAGIKGLKVPKTMPASVVDKAEREVEVGAEAVRQSSSNLDAERVPLGGKGKVSLGAGTGLAQVAAVDVTTAAAAAPVPASVPEAKSSRPAQLGGEVHGDATESQGAQSPSAPSGGALLGLAGYSSDDD